MGGGVSEGTRIDLGTASQFLDGAEGPSQILGKSRRPFSARSQQPL